MASGLGDIFEKSLRTFLKPLVPYWDDPVVSGIFINGPEDIWIERQDGLHKVEEVFTSEHLYQAIRHITKLAGILIKEENPQLHTTLPDGSDISIILPPLSKQGPVVTLKKATFRELSLDELVLEDFLSPSCAEFLEASLLAQQSILLVGPPGSGIDTLMRALVRILPTNERLISLEQGNGKSFKHSHLLRFSLPEQKDNIPSPAAVDLLRVLSLLRPHRLLIEQLTGACALELLHVLQGGYSGSIASVRACHPHHALQIIESKCLSGFHPPSIEDLRRQIAAAFQLFVVCQRRTDGKQELVEVTESLGISKFGDQLLLSLFERTYQGEEVTRPVLPTSAIPSFWKQFQQIGFQHIDRSFFNPDNYDNEGLRVEDSCVPSEAPIGLPCQKTFLVEKIQTSSSTHMKNLPLQVPMPNLEAVSQPSQNKIEFLEKRPTPNKAKSTPTTGTEELEIDGYKSLETFEENSSKDPEALKPSFSLISSNGEIQRDQEEQIPSIPQKQEPIISNLQNPEEITSSISIQEPDILTSQILSADEYPEILDKKPLEYGPQVTEQLHGASRDIPDDMDESPFSPKYQSEITPQTEPTPPHWQSSEKQLNLPESSQNVASEKLVPTFQPVDDPSQILDLSDIIAEKPQRRASNEGLRKIEEELRGQQSIQKQESSTDIYVSNSSPTPPIRAGILPPQEREPAEHSYLYAEEEPTQSGAVIPTQQQTPDSSIPRPSTSPPSAPRMSSKSRVPKHSVVVRRGRRNMYDTPTFGSQDSESTSIRARPPSVPPRSRNSSQNQTELELELEPGSLSTEATVIRGRPPKKGQ